MGKTPRKSRKDKAQEILLDTMATAVHIRNRAMNKAEKEYREATVPAEQIRGEAMRTAGKNYEEARLAARQAYEKVVGSHE